MATVEVKNVDKVYDNKVKAVSNASFAAKDKEFVILVGPSGCGKSTTLRMIAGLEEITKGEIKIGDKIVNNVSPKDRDIAMVFQNYALYPHMSVYENMAFALKLRKYKKEEIDKRVKEAATLLGIGELLDRKPKQLSGGQRQRVALGRAIVRQPKVFLFDEPLSNLDAKLRVQMRAEIIKLHKQLDTTIIYVTHDQTEAMTMANKIVVMKDGIIQQIDSPLKIYDNPNNLFVAGFLGSPAINQFQGKIIKKDDKLHFAGEGFDVAVAQKSEKALQEYVDKPVIMGIRPEDIYDSQYDSMASEPQKLHAICEVVEPLGNEFIVFVKIGDVNSVTARFDPKRLPQIDEKLDVTFDMSRTHYFDTETELAIR
jgi:multiple sugar transport system ATP-binding protein